MSGNLIEAAERFIQPRPLNINRNEAIARIRAALKARTGRAWSVTGGRGTAWGWIKVDAPPARKTWKHRPRPGLTENSAPPGEAGWEEYDAGPGAFGSMGPEDRRILGEAMGYGKPVRELSIPAGSDYYTEHVDRAEGRAPRVTGTPYWD